MAVDKIRVEWLNEPETWDQVAVALGSSPYSYDMDDDSHRLDVVQVVLTALAKVARG